MVVSPVVVSFVVVVDDVTRLQSFARIDWSPCPANVNDPCESEYVNGGMMSPE